MDFRSLRLNEKRPKLIRSTLITLHIRFICSVSVSELLHDSRSKVRNCPKKMFHMIWFHFFKNNFEVLTWTLSKITIHWRENILQLHRMSDFGEALVFSTSPFAAHRVATRGNSFLFLTSLTPWPPCAQKYYYKTSRERHTSVSRLRLKKIKTTS